MAIVCFELLDTVFHIFSEHDHRVLRKMAHDWCKENKNDITLSDSMINEERVENQRKTIYPGGCKVVGFFRR